MSEKVTLKLRTLVRMDLSWRSETGYYSVYQVRGDGSSCDITDRKCLDPFREVIDDGYDVFISSWCFWKRTENVHCDPFPWITCTRWDHWWTGGRSCRVVERKCRTDGRRCEQCVANQARRNAVEVGVERDECPYVTVGWLCREESRSVRIAYGTIS